jgi:hypothetical protein
LALQLSKQGKAMTYTFTDQGLRRYFFDTEFIESGPKKPIQLISIGIVCEDGREFYAVSSEFNEADASDWVKANVLPHVAGANRMSLDMMAGMIRSFVCDAKPEFWAYYADYDWVVFAQIFGTMMDLPKGWPMYCRDIKQECDRLGNPKLPEQKSTEHNALADARWNKDAFEFLQRHAAPAARREGTTKLVGRPLDDNGAIAFEPAAAPTAGVDKPAPNALLIEVSEKEVMVANELATRLGVSQDKVWRLALALYQIHVLGVPQVGDKAAPRAAAEISGAPRQPSASTGNADR